MDRISNSGRPAPAGTSRHRLFDLGVILKGIDGVLEVVSGAVFAAVDVGVLPLIWREYRWRRRVGGAGQG
ncbi:MAG: hypothetical protein ACYCVL_03255 [Gemmatimonadaceae bacterium]